MNIKLLRDVLVKIKDMYGTDTLYQERAANIFSDLAPNARIERDALKRMYSSGAMRILRMAADGSLKVDNAVLRAADALKNNELMDENIARQLVEEMCCVLGLFYNGSCNTSTPRVADASRNSSNTNISCAADASKVPSRSHPNVKIVNDEPPRKSEKQEQEIQKPLDHDDDSLHSDELSRSAERKKIFVIALFGIVGLISIFWWEIGQWLLGAFAGIAMVVWTVCRYRNSGKYGLQAGIIVGISVVNAFLAWLLPTEWSSMACPISLGAAIALFISSCYADDDSEMGTIIVVMAGLDIVVATSVVGGLSSMLIWGMCYLVPALLLLLVITYLYEKMGGRNGKVISSVVAISAIAFHVVLACISPHFLHSFHGYPKLIDTEIGPKRAICYCGEMIELSVEAGTLVHSYTCDYYDSWDLQGGGTYKFDEEGHWLECRCGASFGVKSEHELKNGVCKACGYEEAYLK